MTDSTPDDSLRRFGSILATGLSKYPPEREKVCERERVCVFPRERESEQMDDEEREREKDGR